MRLEAWFIGACVVAFVPFGLPAPSYNTLALQGVLVTVMSLGCAPLCVGRSRGTMFFVGAVAATTAVIAYPPMVLAIALCYVLAIGVGKVSMRAAIICLACFVAGSAAVVVALTPTRLRMMLASGTTSPGFDFAHHATVIAHQLTSGGAFAAICVAAVLVGVFRRRIGAYKTIAAQCVLLLALLLIPPPLFIHSHVAVFVIALTGVGLLMDVRNSAAPADRVVAIIYTVGLAAGITSAWTTTVNGLFNFAVAGFPAALAAIIHRGVRPSAVSVIVGCAFLAVMLSTSVSFHYGEIGSRNQSIYVSKGWYAGLWTTPEEAQIIETSTSALSALRPGCTLAVVGLPVFYLTSPCVPRALMGYPINDYLQPAIFRATLRYYDNPANLPEYVVEYDDRYSSFDFPFPDLHHWPDRYSLAEAHPMPFDGTMRIYQRRARQDVKSP